MQYEINPYEFYVNHPTIGGASIPIDYLGTSFKKGVVSDALCTTGFENAGLMMGGSGDIFGNAAQSYEDPLTTQTPALAVVLNAVPQNLVTTLRIPNPFQALNSSTWPPSGNAELNLLDGGLGGGEVTPYFPLLNKARALDVIIAMDSDVSPFAITLSSELELIRWSNVRLRSTTTLPETRSTHRTSRVPYPATSRTPCP